jgi:hypothetical protein
MARAVVLLALVWGVMSCGQGANSLAGLAGRADVHDGLAVGASDSQATQGGELAALDESTRPVVAILPASIEAIICAAPWPCEEALEVAWCESRLDPQAVGMYGEQGLFQVHPAFWGPVPEDPVGQVAQAFAIWQQYRWEVWTCRP